MSPEGIYKKHRGKRGIGEKFDSKFYGHNYKVDVINKNYEDLLFDELYNQNDFFPFCTTYNKNFYNRKNVNNNNNGKRNILNEKSSIQNNSGKNIYDIIKSWEKTKTDKKTGNHINNNSNKYYGNTLRDKQENKNLGENLDNQFFASDNYNDTNNNNNAQKKESKKKNKENGCFTFKEKNSNEINPIFVNQNHNLNEPYLMNEENNYNKNNNCCFSHNSTNKKKEENENRFPIKDKETKGMNEMNDNNSDFELSEENRDYRLFYTLDKLGLNSLINCFQVYHNMSFNDLLFLTKDDLNELGLKIYQKNRLMNFIQEYTLIAQTFTLNEIQLFFEKNPKFKQ